MTAASEVSPSAEPPTGTPERRQWWEQRQKEREAFLATLPPLRTDIQAVMTVIGRRQGRYCFFNLNLEKIFPKTDLQRLEYGESEKQRLNLQKTDLRRLEAREANLTGVNLSGACLEGANLSSANLSEAALREATLKHASLSWANLRGARLWSTDLSQVLDLTQEHLDSAGTSDRTKLPSNLHCRKFPWEKETSTPSTPTPAPPTAPSTTNSAPSSPLTPDPQPKSQPPEA